MQKWEYVLVARVREMSKSGITDWNCYIWYAGQKNIQKVIADTPVDIMGELGNQGWELVSCIARSDEGGMMYAGFTTTELYYFKRPKE